MSVLRYPGSHKEVVLAHSYFTGVTSTKPMRWCRKRLSGSVRERFSSLGSDSNSAATSFP